MIQDLSFKYKNMDLHITRYIQPPQYRRVRISVDKNGDIGIYYPSGTSEDHLVEVIQKHRRWLSNRLTALENRAKIPALKYVSGERHYFLGEPFILKITTNATQDKVVLTEDAISIFVSKDDPKIIKKILDAWYLEQAQDVFKDRFFLMLNRTPWVKHVGKIRIKSMRSRWGSCSSLGNISLNLALIKSPLSCLDYVIAHELCHVNQHNHSAAFYALLTQAFPDWKEKRKELRSWEPILLKNHES